MVEDKNAYLLSRELLNKSIARLALLQWFDCDTLICNSCECISSRGKLKLTI